MTEHEIPGLFGTSGLRVLMRGRTLNPCAKKKSAAGPAHRPGQRSANEATRASAVKRDPGQKSAVNVRYQVLGAPGKASAAPAELTP
jgi:hypothetical protein